MPAASPQTLDVLRRLAAGVRPLAHDATLPKVAAPDMADVAADTPWELRRQIATGRSRAAMNKRRPKWPRLQPGQLREDDGLHEVDELRLLPLDRLVPTEACTGDASQKRYEQWARQGARIPPLNVTERPDGQLHISDGHHRYCAARAVGMKWLEGWVAVTWTARDGTGLESVRGLTRKTAGCLWNARKDEAAQYRCLNPRL